METVICGILSGDKTINEVLKNVFMVRFEHPVVSDGGPGEESCCVPRLDK